MVSSWKIYLHVFIVACFVTAALSHGPPQDRDSEDIAMGRKTSDPSLLGTGELNLNIISQGSCSIRLMGAKWCSMAKVCNHDRVPVCGLSHAGEVMGFRDLCDMFDYNCIRRRNYKQTACPEDRSILTVSRRPTNSYYDD